MSRWLLSMVLMGSTAFFVGCEQAADNTAGGPGADVRTDDDTEPQNEEATFTAALDSDSIEVAAGSQTEVTVTIDRGEEFDQTVVAEIMPPEGITVEPQQIEFQAGQEEGSLTISADASAQVGDQVSVEVTFQPETGQPLTRQLMVMVTEPEPDTDDTDDTLDPQN